MILRLRSVSDKDESIRLAWPAGNPSSVNLCETEEIAGAKINDELSVPSNGMVTLKIVW